MNPLTYIIINFAIVALIWQGGLRVNVGAITQGEVVALVNYMSQILVELVKLANLIVTVNKSVACGNRIAQVLEMESSMEDGTLEIGENFSEQEMQGKKSVVSFEDVAMCYQGSKEDAITHISFTAGAGETIGIIGGTGSGKTTFLNILSNAIPKDERIITIEDSAELQIRKIPNLVKLETRNANVEGKNAITIRELIKCALRMRPDRIIVGEVRDAAAIDMLTALNTGHDGSLSTGHANSPEDMLSRLETLVLMGMDIPLEAVRRQIASAIEIIVHLGRLRDKSRRVLQIVEVLQVENRTIVTPVSYTHLRAHET